ncbi:MAG: hypothetical protein ABL993_07885 [Vicinamibacterales bacterium]
MPRKLRAALLLLLITASSADAATDATLFRLFLTDGGSVVSYGEFARVDDRVIFAMPVGRTDVQPRLHVVTLPSGRIDWKRTDRYAESARYQWYASSRGEDDFQQMSRSVALVLNEVAQATDRRRALDIAEGARQTLAAWPRSHFGYRHGDVREMLSLLDEAISNLRAAAGISRFDVALVADVRDVPAEPLLGMPSLREQLDQLVRIAGITDRSSERVALLHAAVALINEAGSAIPAAEARMLRRSAEEQIRQEAAVDAKYARFSRRVMASVTRAAARARVADVERALNRIPAEDARLGERRPETIQALRASVQARLEDAQRLRLLRDQWMVRRRLYQDYQSAAGGQLLQLVKLQPALEAIRSLTGPPPETLLTLRGRLEGGATLLERLGAGVPGELRAANDLLIGAWRFAENAVSARYRAATSGEVTTAREASSAAAGALLLLNRAQQEIRTLIEPPGGAAVVQQKRPSLTSLRPR